MAAWPRQSWSAPNRPMSIPPVYSLELTKTVRSRPQSLQPSSGSSLPSSQSSRSSTMRLPHTGAGSPVLVPGSVVVPVSEEVVVEEEDKEVVSDEEVSAVVLVVAAVLVVSGSVELELSVELVVPVVPVVHGSRTSSM